MTTNLMTDLRPGTYAIDPARSACTLRATHFLGLKPVEATVEIRSGIVTVAADAARSTASAELAAGTFRSDDPKRDRDITGKRFLDAARFPVIAFRSTGWSRGDGGWRLTGVLSVRGTDSEVTLAVTSAESTVDGCHVTATGTIDRVAAGVKTARGVIARPIHITLDLHATA